MTFSPKYDIDPDLAEYVSTYAALLKFSKRARERCYIERKKINLPLRFHGESTTSEFDEKSYGKYSNIILTFHRKRDRLVSFVTR